MTVSKTKLIRLTVMGATGRMGARILALGSQDPRFQLVAGVERPGSDAIGHFTADGKTPIVGDIKEVLPKTDAVIDFTEPGSVVRTAESAARAHVPIVIGTTGLNSHSIKSLTRLSRKIPIVFSPNMSVGVNLLFQLVNAAAKAISHYDIEIIEAHHNLKKDAPSGTAMKLAEIAAEASRRMTKDFVYGRKGLIGARKKKEIGISTIRAGDIVGDHTVLFSNPGERLELTHRAHSRDTFAAGALQAAAWIARRRPGFYSMKDVLGL